MSRRAPSPTPLVRSTPIRPTPVCPSSPSRFSISSTPPRPSSYIAPPPPSSRATYPPAGRPPSPSHRLSGYLPARPSSPANGPIRSSSPLSRPRVAFDFGGGGAPVPARPLSGLGRPLPRPRTSSIPTPPPSRPSSAQNFPSLPSHLSFIDPSRPPRSLDPHHFPENQQIPQTNLLMARGKPRLELTHWEHYAAVEMQAALRAHDGVQRECFGRLHPGKGLYPVREEVTKDVECLVEVSVAIMRFMNFSQLILQKLADNTSRLVNITWGDAEEWRNISLYYRDVCVHPIVQCEHNSKIVRQFFDVGFDQFRDTASWLQNAAQESSLPPPFQSLLSHFTNAARSLERLHTAWTNEAEHFVSCDLRRRAQNGSRTAWAFLQHRQAAFESGVRTSVEMRGWLGRAVEKYLNLTRSRGGLSAPYYLEFFQKMQVYLPPGVDLKPRREFCPR